TAVVVYHGRAAFRPCAGVISTPRTAVSRKGVRHACPESQGGREGRRPGLRVDHYRPGGARPARAAGHLGARGDGGAPGGGLASRAVAPKWGGGGARLRFLSAGGEIVRAVGPCVRATAGSAVSALFQHDCHRLGTGIALVNPSGITFGRSRTPELWATP